MSKLAALLGWIPVVGTLIVTDDDGKHEIVIPQGGEHMIDDALLSALQDDSTIGEIDVYFGDSGSDISNIS